MAHSVKENDFLAASLAKAPISPYEANRRDDRRVTSRPIAGPE